MNMGSMYRMRGRLYNLIWASSSSPQQSPHEEGDTLVEQERKVQRPRRYKVIFHNDDYTTRDFVVEVLMRFFNKDESEATFIMLTVHFKGQAVAGVYSKDIAETKVAQVIEYAHAHEMPLKVTTESE